MGGAEGGAIGPAHTTARRPVVIFPRVQTGNCYHLLIEMVSVCQTQARMEHGLVTLVHPAAMREQASWREGTGAGRSSLSWVGNVVAACSTPLPRRFEVIKYMQNKSLKSYQL